MSASLGIPVEWNVEGKNCTFWMRHSDRCSQVTHVGAVVVEALAVIALLAGITLILAQQGYQMGAINTLARTIPSTWLYAGTAVAGALVLLDTALICSLVRSYTSQVFSSEELNQLEFLKNIERHYASDIPPNTYSQYISLSYGAIPAVYAIFSKDSEGNGSLAAFKTENDLAAHIGRLQNKGFTQSEDSVANWKDPGMYTLEQVHGEAAPDIIEKACKRMEDALQDGFYMWEEVYLQNWKENLFLFAAKQQDTTQYFLIRNRTHSDFASIGARHLPGFANLFEMQKVVEDARRDHVTRTLNPNDFIKYTAEFNERVAHLIGSDLHYSDKARPVYIITYRLYSVNTLTEFFFNERECNNRLKELGLKTR